MRSISRAIATATVLLLLGTSAASAQKPQSRKGFWTGFGLGWGSFSCTDCDRLDGEASYTAYLKLGGTVSPHLLLGGESAVWIKSNGGSTFATGSATFNAYYYPKPAGGLFLNGGVGLAYNLLARSGSGVPGGAFGLSLGAGYDLRVGTNISIVPNVEWVYALADGYSQNFYHFALGVTFH